ncbi:lysosomal protective protein-like [Trichosurus vulpecula]|uniref:lysosomal protective protein-like n=1 Tax=Trichosurus vulpecula TaxID=9337 RepID=UPI00186B2ADA|nr:lysosomal protective protein-like [Trichosurus vulpecula]
MGLLCVNLDDIQGEYLPYPQGSSLMAGTKLTFITQLLCSLLALSSLSWGLGTCYYAPDLITSLPGLADLPNFKQWSGYLQAGSDKCFHYWFVESQGKPESNPLVLWLNGGPGCSSMEDLLAENGPYRINDDGSLYTNPHSWNLVANVLYLESPAGVGYSYSSSQNYKINDQQVMVADNYQALQSFFTKFPSFTSNDIYVFVESYGRVYVPSLGAQIVNGPASINFKGFDVGNGMNSCWLSDETLLEFSYYHGMIGVNLWDSLNTYSCSEGSCDFRNSTQDTCFDSILEAYRMIQGVGLNIYNLYAPCWGATGYQERYAADVSNLYSKYQFNVAVPRPSAPGAPMPGVPRCISATAMYVWLNQDNVRQALHIPVFLPTWELCSTQVTSQYQRQYMDMAPFYQELLQSNIRVLVYNGDTDMACNFLGGEKFVEALNQRVMTPYHPWYYKRQVAGYFREYEQITFLTVKGSGHRVPRYRPAQARKMFESFLRNTMYL